MKRMGLDPYPGDEEILRRIAAKQGPLTVSGRGGTIDVRLPKPKKLKPTPTGSIKCTLDGMGRSVRIIGTIFGGARTKKNSTTLGIRQSPGYVKWCRHVVEEASNLRDLATGRMPTMIDAPINLEAHFYVDSKGMPADLAGLLQGFCDALQAAQLVTDDKWIRGFDRSRKHEFDTQNPRVQFTLEGLPIL